MKEDDNDITSAGGDKQLPAPLESHLRSLMQEKELDNFRHQLPPEFIDDASEGLRDSGNLESVLHQLNHQLHHQLTHKKIRKRKTTLKDLSWTYWAAILIFLLVIAGFIVIRMILHHPVR